MRRAMAIAVVGLQVAVLGYMAGQREWVLRTGRPAYLRITPVDPRDPMRGDYLAFSYEAARVPKSLCHDDVRQWFGPGRANRERTIRDRVVYAELGVDDDGIAQVRAVSDRKPSAGLFLRARAEYIADDMLHIRFGAGAMYVSSREAKAFTEQVRQRPGVPIDGKLAVGRDGTAVFQSYRWEPLGMTITLDRVRPESPKAGTQRASAVLRGATIELKNSGDAPVAIVVRPNGGSFRLVRSGWGDKQVVWVGEEKPLTEPVADMVRVLAPNESYREHLDLTVPAWFVRDPQKPSDPPRALTQIDNPWGVSFQFEYAPPTKSAVAGLPHADIIRHSPLRSRSFFVSGVD